MVRGALFADHARAAISAATVRFPPEKCTGVMRLVRPRDVTARLGELDLPVLVTSGGYDEKSSGSRRNLTSASLVPVAAR
jgi:hypothetical protein